MFSLGDKVKDIVTGFEGILIGKTDFLNGCTRWGVQSDTLKDGLPTEAQWFDEPQLELVEAGKVSSGPKDTGGPMPHTPQRNPIPSR